MLSLFQFFLIISFLPRRNSFSYSFRVDLLVTKPVCRCPVAKSYPTLCDPMNCSMPGFPVFHYLLEFAQTHVHWVSDVIQPAQPLLPLLLLPAVFPSISVFSNESALCIRWPKYWSFSCSISPSNEYSGLISFRMDWSDLLAVQGTLKNLLQHLSSKASILRCSAFFTVQRLHSYMTTGKTIALTRQTFVGKVMFLLFNVLSRLSWLLFNMLFRLGNFYCDTFKFTHCVCLLSSLFCFWTHLLNFLVWLLYF